MNNTKHCDFVSLRSFDILNIFGALLLKQNAVWSLVLLGIRPQWESLTSHITNELLCGTIGSTITALHKHERSFVLFRKGQQPNVLFAKSNTMNSALCLHSVFLELTVSASTALQFLMWTAEKIHSGCKIDWTPHWLPCPGLNPFHLTRPGATVLPLGHVSTVIDTVDHRAVFDTFKAKVTPASEPQFGTFSRMTLNFLILPADEDQQSIVNSCWPHTLNIIMPQIRLNEPSVPVEQWRFSPLGLAGSNCSSTTTSLFAWLSLNKTGRSWTVW